MLASIEFIVPDCEKAGKLRESNVSTGCHCMRHEPAQISES
jgi:hypothetical protein